MQFSLINIRFILQCRLRKGKVAAGCWKLLSELVINGKLERILYVNCMRKGKNTMLA